MIASVPELLHTKLAIPIARADRVSRPRLTHKLNACLEHPLTVICAPAGFGKTTLITDWNEQPDKPYFPLAWLSLDEDDNDPIRFLIYLVSAVGTIHSHISDALLSRLQSPQPPHIKSFLTLLLNHLGELPNRFALVLDDYHLITAQPIHDVLTFLLDHRTSNMSLILTSRADPPLALGRLRAHNQMSEFRADDLRFTSEETATFLQHTLSIDFPDEQITALSTRTEGWVVGLQLAVLAMKGRKDALNFIAAFAGSHRYILDYLTDEVLSRQPELLQNFLMQTSILNRFTGSLCDAVTGRTDGQTLLEQVETGNLFLIPLDDDGYWYRYHHLFADMLRKRLQQIFPDLLSILYLRASKWFEQNGWIGEAVEHALRGQSYDRAGDLVELYGEKIWRRGEVSTLLRWINALPEETVQTRFESHPELGLNYALMLIMADEHTKAEYYVEKMEQTLSQQEHRFEADEYKLLLGRAAAVRSTLMLQLDNNGDGAISAAQQALANLPLSEVQWRGWVMLITGVAYYDAKGNLTEGERYLTEATSLSEKVNDVYTRMVVLSVLSKLHILQGKLRKAESVSNQLLQYIDHQDWMGQAYLNRSRVRYEHNDLSGALEDITETFHLMQDAPVKRVILESHFFLSQIKQIQGYEDEALDLMSRAVELMQVDNLGDYFNSGFARQAQLWLVQGNLTAVEEWANRIALTAHDDFSFAHEFEHITLARIQIAQGRLEEAQTLLARLCTLAIDAGRMGRVIAICALQSLAAKRQGKIEQAFTSLEYALSLAEPEDFVRTFVDEGIPMAELLHAALKRGIAPSYVAKLLAAFNHNMSSANVSPLQYRVSGDGEALSEREFDVLRLIAEGSSNREIAEQLIVSLGTVKKHLNNIFLKLDAHSRTQAIVIARKLNLL